MKTISLTENKLRQIIKETIMKVIPITGTSSVNLNENIHFRLDKISEHTLYVDRRYRLTEAQADNYNWLLRKRNWEVNNYQRFIDIVDKTPTKPANLKGFLTKHDMDEITQKEWITYTLKGYDVAFALHYIAPGQIDICNLVNNSELKGIGDLVLKFAKSEGGTQMDNYRGVPSETDPQGNGKLGNLYRKNGFDRQTWSAEFDPQYQPEEEEWKFDTEHFGTPDVEGLELSKHRRKYNNPQNRYKEKFDKRIGNKFH